jgi:hypothetical protein
MDPITPNSTDEKSVFRKEISGIAAQPIHTEINSPDNSFIAILNSFLKAERFWRYKIR